MWNFDYSAHASFVDPARAKSEPWRLALGLTIIPVLSIVLFAAYNLSIMSGLVQFGYAPNSLNMSRGDGPMAMLLMLAGFGIFTASIAVVVATLHNREILSVLGPIPRLIPQFLRVSGMMIVALVAITILPPWGYGAPLMPNLAPGLWAALLPLSLVAVFLQISAEEILFRGYMQQQLAARFNSPLMWMVVPSAIFALGHYDPATAGDNAMILVVWAGIFGMLMADLTARSGSLGPALAVHFVNNVAALLIVSIPDTLNGLALYHLPFGMGDTEIMRAWLKVDFMFIVICWLVARIAIRK